MSKNSEIKNGRVEIISHGETIVYSRLQKDVVKEYVNDSFQPNRAKNSEGFYSESEAQDRINHLLTKPGFEVR